MDAYVGNPRVTTTQYHKVKGNKQMPPTINRPANPKTFEENVHEVFVELEELLLSKHHDYGPKNIAEAPGGAHNGLRVRLYDKLARLSHWVEAKSVLKHETAEESYEDVANYGVIGILVSRGLWPNE